MEAIPGPSRALEEKPHFIKRGRGLVLFFNGHQYYKNRRYNDGAFIWRCSSKDLCGKQYCTGSLTVKVSVNYCCLSSIRDKDFLLCPLYYVSIVACLFMPMFIHR